MLKFYDWLKLKGLSIPTKSVESVLALKKEGATVPFIARYRKEQTGNLDEVQVQALFDATDKFEEFTKRKEFILKEIEAQGKLDSALQSQIESCSEENILEDLYLPYKKKKKTKATIAKEAGLEPLAQELWKYAQGELTWDPSSSLEKKAQAFLNATAGFADTESVLKGLNDIFIESISEQVGLRERVRRDLFANGFVVSKKGDEAKPHSKYERFFEYKEKVVDLNRPEASHRYLALRRGWTEKELSLGIEGPFEALQKFFEEYAVSSKSKIPTELKTLLDKSARLALKGVVLPSIENEVHAALKATSEAAAIQVFAANVRKILMAAPLGNQAVLGIDPGIRTGCKLAAVDKVGTFLESTVIYPDMGQKREEAKLILLAFLQKHKVEAISIGNGTAGRETEDFVRKILKEFSLNIPVAVVSETGASVYSASAIAREEFPELDLTIRGAISIARRLQNPIAELVKVDPQSLGVGQYQHDVSESKLEKTLKESVISCVHQVGVDINLSSHTLLSHISGLGLATAKNIVEFRSKNGPFKTKLELKKVSRLSEKMFELAAGFVRIPGADNPLDNTGIHPEKYPLLEEMAQSMKCSLKELVGPGAEKLLKEKSWMEKLGPFTLQDVVQELKKPGRDPRANFTLFQFREDIKDIKDLSPGMKCPGLVTNVTNFGAFIDIGVHRDGLVHLSELADRFVKDPQEVVKVGDVVMARVLNIDLQKNLISLSLKSEGSATTNKTHSVNSSSQNSYTSAPSRTPSASSGAGGAFAALAALKGQLPMGNNAPQRKHKTN